MCVQKPLALSLRRGGNGLKSAVSECNGSERCYTTRRSIASSVSESDVRVHSAGRRRHLGQMSTWVKDPQRSARSHSELLIACHLGAVPFSFTQSHTRLSFKGIVNPSHQSWGVVFKCTGAWLRRRIQQATHCRMTRQLELSY